MSKTLSFLCGALLLSNAVASADPLFTLDEKNQALEIAAQQNLIVAWVCALPDNATPPVPALNKELAQLVMDQLRNNDNNCVIIYLAGAPDFDKAPEVVQRDMLTVDDPLLMNGNWHFYSPKVVFTDPDVSKAYGRVSFTELSRLREQPLLGLIHRIRSGLSPVIPPTPTPMPPMSPESSSAFMLMNFHFRNTYILILLMGVGGAGFAVLIVNQLTQKEEDDDKDK